MFFVFTIAVIDIF